MFAPQQRRAVRTVVVLLVANLAVSLAFGVLTLLFRHDIVTYQQARHPGTDPDALTRAVWSRAVPLVAVAVLYFWVCRRLLAGSPRAYRRVRIVSVLGLLAVGWLFVSAAYPAWLRAIQAGQLVVLAALVVAVNRHTLRAAFAAVPDPRPRSWRAAWTLALLAPLVAEVSLGSVPLRQAWLIPIFVPVYGAGVLFIREVVRRTGGGFTNLLIMGVVYGLIEEGLALQSLTSPHLYGAAGWAPRLFGLNTAYAELNLAYHSVFSVTIPIALVELLYARHGNAPYLRRGGVIITGIVALLGAALLRVAVPPAEDPGYTMPLLAVLLIASLTATLTVVALRVRVRPAPPVQPPHAGTVAGAAGAATIAFLGLIWPFAGARQPLFTHGAWALLPMAGAALIVVATLTTLRRWSASPSWTPRHLLAACISAMVGHTVFGLIVRADTVADRCFLGAVALLTSAIGIVASRRLARARTTGTGSRDRANQMVDRTASPASCRLMTRRD